MVKCTTTSVGSWKAYMLSITVLLSMLQLSNQVQIQISTPSTCGVAICFAIDDSGSIGSTPFQSARTFVKEVITQVSAISPVSQYGASQFSNTGIPVPGLGSMTTDATAAQQAITNMDYRGARTNMEAGIAVCFNKDSGSPGGVLTNGINKALPRIIVLLTDGIPNEYTTQPPGGCTPTSTCPRKSTEWRADTAKADGIKFVTVGVGSGVDETFLKSLGDYYKVTDYASLITIVQDIVKAVCSDVSISKEAQFSPTPIGSRVNYIITLTNEGEYDVGPTTFTFTDVLPSGLAYNSTEGISAVDGPKATCSDQGGGSLRCQLTGTLTKGSSFIYSLPYDATQVGIWENTVTLSVQPDNNGQNDVATATVNVTEPAPPPPITADDLNITKTANATTVMLGDMLQFTVTVRNDATLTTAVDAVVTDAVPAGLQVIPGTLSTGCSVTGTPETLSCGPFNLAAGESKVLTYTVIAVDDGQFLNQASISVGPVTKGPAIETVVVQNSCKKYEFSGNAIVPFDCGDGYKAKPGAGGSLTPDKNTCCEALTPNVEFSKSVDKSSVLISNNVTYTITVNNTGEGVASNAVVLDTLPAGLVFVESLDVNCFFPERCPLGENSCQQPNTNLTKLQCGPVEIAPGSVKTYRVIAKAIEARSWTNSATASFKSTTGVSYTAGPATATVTVEQTCSVYFANGDPFECPAGTELDPTNATSSNPGQAVCCADIPTPSVELLKRVDKSSVLISNNVTYTITVNNTGEGVAKEAVVLDTLPAGLVFVESLDASCFFPERCPGGQSNCQQPNTNLTKLQCGPVDIAPGSVKTYRVIAKAIEAGSWTNSATASFNSTTGVSDTAGPATATLTIRQTCSVYFANGDPFECRAGTQLDPTNANNPNPGQVVCCGDAGGFTATKAAYRKDGILCGSDASTCSIAAGEDFFWVVQARVNTGTFSSFTINDTVAPAIATGADATFRVNGQQVGGGCPPSGTINYSCTLGRSFGSNDVVQLWIPVKSPAGLQQKQTVSNAAFVAGTPTLGTPTTENPTSSVTLLKQLVCDARVEKLTPNPTPVFVGGSPEPPTTTIITKVTVGAGNVCDQVVLTSTLDSGLDILSTPFATGGGACSLQGSRVYTCSWPSTTGAVEWSVTAVIRVVQPFSQTPALLKDVGVLNADSNPSNNQATATVQVLSGAIPDLFVTKSGPAVLVPVNKTAEFFVVAGVSNQFMVTELTLVERLSGLSGAYFLEPYPDGCSATAVKPIELVCKWTGPSVTEKRLTFKVTSTVEGTVLNTATVSTPGGKTATDTDTAQFCDSACPPAPTVSVDKTVDIGGAQYIAPDVEFTYTIEPKLLTGVAVTVTVFDFVDPAITFVSVVNPATGCSISAHAALCEVAPGTKIVLRAKATEPGSWINTVKVVAGSSSAVDTITVTVFRSTCGDVTFGPPKDRFTGCPAEFPYDPNNADKFPPGIDTCCDLNAQDTPTITLTKTSSSNQVTAGQTVDWTLLITNEAGLTPVTAENVEVVDPFPAGVRANQNSVSISGGTAADRCTFAGRVMTCNLNDLPPGAARVIQVTVTALNTNKRRKVTNTATVTCDVRGAPSAGCTDTAEDDITIIPAPPAVVPVSVDKTVNPRKGPKGAKFTFTIVVEPVTSGTTATSVVLTDVIDRSLTNVRLITSLGGKCSFNQGTYTLTCNWAKLRTKQTVRFEVRGSRPGATLNTAEVTFTGGSASSSAGILVEEAPKGSCCDGESNCFDGIIEAECKAKGSGALWSSWAAVPVVTCASSTFCKGACCSSGLASCNCPWCRQTLKSECTGQNDKWTRGADCNTLGVCPSQCKTKCQPCSGPGDTSCCPGLACVCSGSKWGSRYVCAQVNPWGPWSNWGKSKFGSPRSNDVNIKTDLTASLGSPCGRLDLQCEGPGVDCVLNGNSESGTCMLRNTLKQQGESCSGHGQCAGGLRCEGGACKRATCPKQSQCRANDFQCLANYTWNCQVFYAHTMSSFDG